MQNDFGSKGGLLDRLGMSIAEIRAVIPPTGRALAAARSAGIPIVYLKMAYRPDLSDLGASDAPNRIGHLQAGVGKTVAAPNGVPSRILIRTSAKYSTSGCLRGQAGGNERLRNTRRCSQARDSVWKGSSRRSLNIQSWKP
jgi:ureidoacrylate peracid hydrolase